MSLEFRDVGQRWPRGREPVKPGDQTRFPREGVKSRRTSTVGSEPWPRPQRENEAASVWEGVVSGKPGRYEVLEVKRRKCLLEERVIKGVNSAERPI